MKQGKKLLILPAVAVLLGMGTGCSDNSENEAQNMAKKALMASVDNPESVKIVGISKPDSVFGREYVTMKEKMALSVAIMKISRRFMESKHSKKCTFYTLRFGCSFAAVNTIKPQLL